jgi:hypothetical protein
MRQHYYGYKANLAWKQGRRAAHVFLAEMEKAGESVIRNALEYQTVSGGRWHGWTQDDPREWPRGEEIWGYNSNAAGKWYHEFASKYGKYTLSELHPKLAAMVKEMGFAPRATLDVHMESGALSVFGAARRFLDIGNTGQGSFRWTARASRPWIRVLPASGEVHAADARLWVSADWQSAPLLDRDTEESVTIDAGPAGTRSVTLWINNPRALRPESIEGHVEADGYLAIEAEHYWKKIDRGGARWLETRISFADDGYSMCAEPLTRAIASVEEAPELVYRLNIQNAGDYFLNFSIFDRTLYKNFLFALDGGAPVLVDSNYPRRQRDEHERNIPLRIDRPGVHYLHVWMRDPGVVIDRIVFTREPADFGNFGIFAPVAGTSPRFRAAAPRESYWRMPAARR